MYIDLDVDPPLRILFHENIPVWKERERVLREDGMMMMGFCFLSLSLSLDGTNTSL